LLLLAALLALIGVLLIKKIRPPERAIRSTKATRAAVRGSRSGARAADGTAAAAADGATDGATTRTGGTR
jgi:hypothetical protein